MLWFGTKPEIGSNTKDIELNALICWLCNKHKGNIFAVYKNVLSAFFAIELLCLRK